MEISFNFEILINLVTIVSLLAMTRTDALTYDKHMVLTTKKRANPKVSPLIYFHE